MLILTKMGLAQPHTLHNKLVRQLWAIERLHSICSQIMCRLGSISVTTAADNSVMNFMKLAFAEVCQMVVHGNFSGFSLLVGQRILCLVEQGDQ